MNIDFLFIFDFTDEFAKKTAKQFLEILLSQLQCKGILLGFNHYFGKNREGNFKFLQRNQNKYHYDLYQLPAIFLEKELVSSSSIKKLIIQGAIEKANQMLGRYYSIQGTVVKGEQEGRKLGFPTINLSQNQIFVHLPKGVYVGKVLWKQKEWNCMINIGSKPTFYDNHKISIESHIFDFEEDLYGQEVKIFFYHKIREEIKFESKEKLKEQLIKDQKKSMELLN